MPALIGCIRPLVDQGGTRSVRFTSAPWKWGLTEVGPHMPRRTAGPAIAGAVLLVVTGCGARHDPAPAASVPVTTPVSAAPSEPAYSTTPVIAKPKIGSLRGVSRGSAEAAVTTLIGYVRADSYAPRRMQPKSDYSAADFAGPAAHMTPELRKRWLAHVAAKYQDEAAGQVRVIAFVDMAPNNDAFAAKGPLVVDERISKVTVSGAARVLKVGMTYRADLRMVDTIDIGRPILMPVTKTVTYTIVRSKGTWLIDGYDGTYDWGPAPKPSTQPSVTPSS